MKAMQSMKEKAGIHFFMFFMPFMVD